MGSISSVNCRISCLQITQARDPPFRRAEGLISRKARPAIVFSLRVVCPCGRAMSGIAEVIASFFFSEKVKRSPSKPGSGEQGSS